MVCSERGGLLRDARARAHSTFQCCPQTITQERVNPIKPNQTIVAIKDSKIDYDCRRLNLTPRQLLRFYARSGYPPAKIENIQASHELQQQGKKVLHDLIDSDRIISRSSFNPALLRKQKLVLTFGGDNHFQYVARYLTDT